MCEAYATFGLLTGAFELIMNNHEKYRFDHSSIVRLRKPDWILLPQILTVGTGNVGSTVSGITM